MDYMIDDLHTSFCADRMINADWSLYMINMTILSTSFRSVPVTTSPAPFRQFQFFSPLLSRPPGIGAITVDGRKGTARTRTIPVSISAAPWAPSERAIVHRSVTDVKLHTTPRRADLGIPRLPWLRRREKKCKVLKDENETRMIVRMKKKAITNRRKVSKTARRGGSNTACKYASGERLKMRMRVVEKRRQQSSHSTRAVIRWHRTRKRTGLKRTVGTPK